MWSVLVQCDEEQEDVRNQCSDYSFYSPLGEDGLAACCFKLILNVWKMKNDVTDTQTETTT